MSKCVFILFGFGDLFVGREVIIWWIFLYDIVFKLKSFIGVVIVVVILVECFWVVMLCFFFKFRIVFVVFGLIWVKNWLNLLVKIDVFFVKVGFWIFLDGIVWFMIFYREFELVLLVEIFFRVYFFLVLSSFFFIKLWDSLKFF